MHILAPSLILVITIGWFWANRLKFRSHRDEQTTQHSTFNELNKHESKRNTKHLNNEQSIFISLSWKLYIAFGLVWFATLWQITTQNKAKQNQTFKWTHQPVQIPLLKQQMNKVYYKMSNVPKCTNIQRLTPHQIIAMNKLKYTKFLMLTIKWQIRINKQRQTVHLVYIQTRHGV